MTKAWMVGAALATCLGAASAVAAPAQMDDGVYSARTDAPMLVQARVHRWTCTAHSPTSSGWESSTSLAVARSGALAQCAVRTRRGLVCRLTSCR